MRSRMSAIVMAVVLILLTIIMVAQLSFAAMRHTQYAPAANEHSRWDVKRYLATKRGTILVRWGYHQCNSKRQRFMGFGYRHIIGGEHGWYPRRISTTISQGRLIERAGTSYTRVKWYKNKNGKCPYRVVYNRRTNTPDGKMLGVVTAYMDVKRCKPNRKNPPPCSLERAYPSIGYSAKRRPSERRQCSIRIR